MYDLITWHPSALHLYICLVRPPPQAYQSKPFSPSHFPYSFILINSQVWKVHFVWNFNLKFYHRENAIIVKVNGVNFRILTELFYQNMFECSLLQHMYRPKWTVLQKRHTFHKLLVYWYLQGDTWFSWIGNKYLIWTWNGIGFTVVTNVRHLEHPEIPYLNTRALEIW